MMNYDARGTILSIDWIRKDLQKGKIKKIEGEGPRIITFFRPTCTKVQLVVLGKIYKYNLEDIEPELDILNDLQDPISRCLNEDENDLFEHVLYSRTTTEKKKVAVDLEED